MARKFLYFIAFIIVVVILGGIALSIWSREATEIAFVPRGDFVEQEALAENAYEDPGMWYSRPGIGTDDPARYQPAIAETPEDPATREPSPEAPAAERTLGETAPSFTPESSRRAEPVTASETPDFAVFFVPPTSYIQAGGDWNASLTDASTNQRARIFLRGLASPFNNADEIWAPKYRQAAVGAFLTDRPEAQLAIDAAYRDVREAFAYFLESVDPAKPIVLAGHSQGALHILRLLMEEVAGSGLEARVVAVYAPGWPISVEHDLPALPFPACAAPGQVGCVLGWSSFADDNDPGFLMRRYGATPAFNGQPRGDGPILCVNPLTGGTNGEAPASSNLGTLVPDEGLSRGELVPGAVPARCDASGLLLIGDPPDLGEGVLPGNNFHVYDIPLFWANVQQDVLERVRAWTPAGS
ncbi:hypothetical protein A9995_11035 [Erythrobacter sp. QSSC1-22B]|uniref:DUF3089 domain-containing protein n=1 Tax=Erythrobacter sp. QSSC1-22B TaxID=1860125 RepID=UPI000804995C|nr:DUF3089 domain-containing protein [Erythrobacter sp. QSSC1-22B]OBX18501.1 hypothetical protein A9995_11035 [Erythrobacter sp. QSSC1-22B]